MTNTIDPSGGHQDDAIAREFVAFAVEAGVLRFGEFKTKAGRLSPYFFNAGAFDDGARLGRLAEFYARRLISRGLAFDMIFGPAYKGITLAAALAVELARRGRNVPFAYNRKEEKSHGEGGALVGAPLSGQVLIIDDVISDGASKAEAAAWIRNAGARACGIVIALDRQELAGEAAGVSGVQQVERTLGLQVVAIAGLADLLRYLQRQADPQLAQHLPRVLAYRERYGVRD